MKLIFSALAYRMHTLGGVMQSSLGNYINLFNMRVKKLTNLSGHYRILTSD